MLIASLTRTIQANDPQGSFRFARCNAVPWRNESPAATHNAQSEAKLLERYASSSQYGLEVKTISDENLNRYFISKRPANAPRGVDNPRVFSDATPEDMHTTPHHVLKREPRTSTHALKIVFNDPRYTQNRIITGVRIARRKDREQ